MVNTQACITEGHRLDIASPIMLIQLSLPALVKRAEEGRIGV